MPDFNFVGASYVAASPTQNDQECYNWFPEIDQTKPQGERGVIALYPTPGMLLRLQSATVSEVREMHVIPGGTLLLAVIGPTLYSITQGYVATAVGTLTTNNGACSITDNGTSAYIVDGQNRYTYVWSTGVFAQIAAGDGAFNGGGQADEVDNFIIYTNPGTNQWGCTNVGSTVSGALNLGTKLGSSDNIVALIVNHRDVLLIGETTTEDHVNVGTFPFAFQIIPGTSMQHGCTAPRSVARLGESAAWLSQDTRGQAIVIMMNGYAPKRISTFAVEQAISRYTTVNDAIGFTYQQAGHEFYMLTFPSADVTWCYDLATELWHKRAWRDGTNVLHRHRGNCVAGFNGEVVVGDWQNGRIYAFSQTTYTDADVTIMRVRRCPHLVTDLKRQYFHDLQIQFQPGVGLATGQGSDPKVILEWSDDGGFTWSNQYMTGIGQIGKFKHRAIWRRLGEARDRIFQVTLTDPVYGTVVSANLNATAGAH